MPVEQSGIELFDLYLIVIGGLICFVLFPYLITKRTTPTTLGERFINSSVMHALYFDWLGRFLSACDADMIKDEYGDVMSLDHIICGLKTAGMPDDTLTSINQYGRAIISIDNYVAQLQIAGWSRISKRDRQLLNYVELVIIVLKYYY